MKTIILAAMTVVLVFAVSCSSSKTTSGGTNDPYAGYTSTPSGLKYLDMSEGKGEMPRNGQKITVDYIGRLEDGTVFENSYEQKKPLTFNLGDESILRGWNEAVSTMRKGGKRMVVVPPELGYGSRTVRNIPANSVLVFQIELLEIK